VTDTVARLRILHGHFERQEMVMLRWQYTELDCQLCHMQI